jgi:hypothetical protein
MEQSSLVYRGLALLSLKLALVGQPPDWKYVMVVSLQLKTNYHLMLPGSSAATAKSGHNIFRVKLVL